MEENTRSRVTLHLFEGGPKKNQNHAEETIIDLTKSNPRLKSKFRSTNIEK